MKRTLILLLLIINTGTLFARPAPKDVFKKALLAYRHGDYQECVDRLQGLQKVFGNRAPVIYYNLGVCEYKLEQYGMALYHFLLASKSSNSQLHDISLAAAQKVRLTLTQRQASLKNALKRYVFEPYQDWSIVTFGWVPFTVFVWLGLILWFMGFVMVGLARLGVFSSAKTGAYIIVASVIVGIFTYGKYTVMHYKYGILVSDTPFYTSMSMNDQSEELPEGLEVRVLKMGPEVVRIRLTKGTVGFVPSDTIKVIPPSLPDGF